MNKQQCTTVDKDFYAVFFILDLVLLPYAGPLILVNGTSKKLRKCKFI